MSTGCEAFIYHSTTTRRNTRSLVVANHTKPAKNVFNMCRTFWTYTPDQFRPPLPEKYRGNPPTDRMEFPTLESDLSISTARSIEQYLSYGLTHMHASEVARWPQGRELMTALMPTLNKTPVSMFFGESTALGQGNYFHEQCMEAYESGGEKSTEYGAFRLLFIPFHEMPLTYRIPITNDDDGLKERRHIERTLTDEEKRLMRTYKTFGLEQVKWLRYVMSQSPFKEDPDRFQQEFPENIETAFLSTGSGLFSPATMKALSTKKRHPIFEGDIFWGESTLKNRQDRPYDTVRRPLLLTPGEAKARAFDAHTNEGTYNNLRIFRYPVKGEKIVIGGDVAHGNPNTKGGDYSTLVVLVNHDHEATQEVVATWRGHCNPMIYGEIAAALSWKFREHVGEQDPPELAIEWNRDGTAANEYIDSFGLYAPTYRYRNPGVHKQPKSKHIGWETNAKTKPIAVANMRKAIEQRLVDIPDERILVELNSYKQFDGFGDEGSFGGEGCHDDLISALQIAITVGRRKFISSNDGDAPKYIPQDDGPGTVPFDPFDGVPDESEDEYGFSEDEGDDTDEAWGWW